MVLLYVIEFQVLLNKEELSCNKHCAESSKSSKNRFTIASQHSGGNPILAIEVILIKADDVSVGLFCTL